MIGPKQFDIGHKFKPKKDLLNPLVNKIFEPKFKYREENLREIVDSFADTFKSPLFEFEEEDIKPLARVIEIPRERHEGKFKSVSGSFMDRFNAPKPIKPRIKSKERSQEKEEDELSDEMIQKITYKVFQNIKNYLDKDSDKPMGNRQIKLEISL